MADFGKTMGKTPTMSKAATLGKPKMLSREPNMGSPTNKQDHMMKRKSDGLSHRDVAEEFGVSKSTSHRMTGNSTGPSSKRGSQGFDKAATDDTIPD